MMDWRDDSIREVKPPSLNDNLMLLMTTRMRRRMTRRVVAFAVDLHLPSGEDEPTGKDLSLGDTN